MIFKIAKKSVSFCKIKNVSEKSCFVVSCQRRFKTWNIMSTSMMSDKEGQLPLEKLVVVVLGSTASGKSKLAIDLAKHVGGEVISADSMQVYDGLDILTNKATKEEMQGVPHHMISVADRMEKFDVVQFRNKALPIVEDLLSKGKVPFIVGGTNYYIESLLWKVLMEDDTKIDSQSSANSGSHSCSKKFKLDQQHSSEMTATTMTPLQYMKEIGGDFTEADAVTKWSATELHTALSEVDPSRALKVHPMDTRKVVRSLQVFFQRGRKHSELIEEQCAGSGEEAENSLDCGSTPTSLTPKLGGPLRFPNSICFWIQADRDILNERIYKRVDQMVERGIKEELDDYVDWARQENVSWDFEEGQLQSIGVKEFQSYIELPPEDRNTENGQKLFTEGLDRLKVVTRQYAKRQVQWISQRFLKSSRRQLPRVYGLDGNETDSKVWNTNVTSPAIQILDAHLNNQLDSSIINEKVINPVDDDPQDFINRKCEVCDKILVGSLQYDIHMKSARHWKMVKRKKRIEEGIASGEDSAPPLKEMM